LIAGKGNSMKIKRSYGTITVPSMRQVKSLVHLAGGYVQYPWAFAPEGYVWVAGMIHFKSLYVDDRLDSFKTMKYGLIKE